MSLPAVLIAAEEAHRELPIPPWLVGVIALVAFAVLLGITWSFRGTHHKYARPGVASQHDGHGTLGTHGTRDEAHWPEHPGQH